MTTTIKTKNKHEWVIRNIQSNNNNDINKENKLIIINKQNYGLRQIRAKEATNKIVLIYIFTNI